MALLKKKTLEDLNFQGKKVIMRVDFNVPLESKTGVITDDNRIRAALPTIRYLLDKKAKLILVSHLGRPKGFDSTLSMAPVAKRLSELLGQKVILAADVIGDDAKAKAAALQEGEILMLENVRFHPEETKNDRGFAKELSSMAEIYVNDAFGTAHRAHASIYGLAKFLPSASGYLIQKELEVMAAALDAPERPFTALIGGAKVSDKIGVLENLLDKVDNLLIGGAMAYTFYAACGWETGTSPIEPDKKEIALSILAKAEEKGVRLLLPADNVISDDYSADAKHKIVPCDQFEPGWMGMDIGPRTVEKYSAVLKESKTVIWNGPLGVFEFAAFAQGTKKIATAVADSGATSIIGGGDSASALEQLGFADKVTHISTGGGASLELMEGKVLPGLAALSDQDSRRLLAAGNWKMNKGTPAEAGDLIAKLLPLVTETETEVVLGVPFTVLPEALKLTAGTEVAVAAQNAYPADSGAYTGEISMKMLADLNVSYVIVGHSERRQYFQESNADINAKIKAALSWGVLPIICVGESLEQRENNETFDFIRQQIRECLVDIRAEDCFRVIIAYEPIWAIGTGRTATNEQAQEVCAFIRQELIDLYDANAAGLVRILYGGSVNASNAAGLFAMPDVDGGLVGGASLKAEDFALIAGVKKE
ncbi:MAG TPA: triose-phosphate isomerase [Clostridiaceae bacterium]|nr:triose-phosphate isomerase [Clostridiaceae bacterium]